MISEIVLARMSVTPAKTPLRDRADGHAVKRRKLYSQTDMDDALRLAYDEDMGLEYAAAETCVPLRTIKYRHANPLAGARSGPKTVLSDVERRPDWSSTSSRWPTSASASRVTLPMSR